MNAPVANRAAHDRQMLTAALAGVAAGDRDALRDVYDRTAAKLFGLCLRILGDRSEAEDTMQDIYLSVWRRAGSFNPDRASPITWLSVIARNRAIDRLRASGRSRATVPIEYAAEVADPSPDAFVQLDAAEDSSRLRACIENLETRQASAIRAAYFGGITYSELAEQADVPLGTMKSWVRRGLIRLRECFER